MSLIPPTSRPSQTPRIILGLMTFGPPGTEDKGSRITSLDEYKQCLDFLQQKGYNELDTAKFYIAGQQEGFTREAGWKERGFSLATKCFPDKPGDHEPEHLRQSLEKSLKELGTDCVDIFYLHAPDRSVPFDQTLKACNKMHKEGKFVKLGLSNYAAWEVAEIVNIAKERCWVRPTVYQAMYNAITRAIEPELVPCCRKYGIDIVVFNPLAGGLFSGKIKSKDGIPSSGRFSSTADSQGQMYRSRYFKSSTFIALSLVESLADQHNLTLLEIALRWIVHHSSLKTTNGSGDGIIIGVSSMDQLKGNVADLEKGPLPEQVVMELDRIWEEIMKSETDHYWR